jgi:hypothetical protein
VPKENTRDSQKWRQATKAYIAHRGPPEAIIQAAEEISAFLGSPAGAIALLMLEASGGHIEIAVVDGGAVDKMVCFIGAEGLQFGLQAMGQNGIPYFYEARAIGAIFAVMSAVEWNGSDPRNLRSEITRQLDAIAEAAPVD